MSSLMIASKFFYKKSDTINNLSIACLAILTINPYQILNLGFQLSFLGTIGIVLLNKKMNYLFDKYSIKILIKVKFPENIKKFLLKIKSIVIVSVCANIFIVPIMVYSFNSISIIFLISNVLICPILGVLLLMGYLTIFFSMFSIRITYCISIIFNFCVNISNGISIICSKITLGRFLVTTPRVIFIILYYWGILYFIYFYRKKHNKIIVRTVWITVLITVLFNIVLTNNSKLEIHFIDVGQGDSTLVITPNNKKILIDGGGSEFGDYDIGEKILVPYLLDMGIKNIDYIMFSHFDSDHAKRFIVGNGKIKRF